MINSYYRGFISLPVRGADFICQDLRSADRYWQCRVFQL